MAIATPKKRSLKSASKPRRRIDVALVRKSSTAQDERQQVANIKSMLILRNIEIPDDQDHWFKCTVPRADVQGNVEFKRLLNLIEDDKIGTVYVESQDRWGTNDVSDFFVLIRRLREHRTKLICLREDFDLTSTDDIDELRAFIGGMKSKRERSDLAYRVMRTKVNSFLASGSWPSGVHPFGFGKVCYAVDGKTVKWKWQPESRTVGQLIYVEKGKDRPGPSKARLIRKELKSDVIKLIPSTNRDHVRTVRTIFDLYVNSAITFRSLAIRLNNEGRRFYDKLFTHALVRSIVMNPAYVGDTYYGKVRSGRIHTFDKKGVIVKVDHGDGKAARSEDEQLVKKNTHDGLIDRKMWNRAQEKLRDMRTRVTFAPSNPDYYLKQILVCGHCGKNMTGRTEVVPRTKDRVVVYMCSSYVAGRSKGVASRCGAHRITHKDAEQLLMDKIKELNLEYETLKSVAARENRKELLANHEEFDLPLLNEREEFIQEGIDTFMQYHREAGVTSRQVHKLLRDVQSWYISNGEPVRKNVHSEELWEHSKELKKLVERIEALAAAAASKKLVETRKKLNLYVEKLVESDWGDAQKEILQNKINALEIEIKDQTARSKPLGERYRELSERWDDVESKYETLLDEMPGMESREKGESLRRLFKHVTLYWSREFVPASKVPARSLKTSRPGRNRFSLLKNKIGWEFEAPQLGGSL